MMGVVEPPRWEALKQELRRGVLPRWQRHQQGQMAVVFIVLMALVLMLVPITMNLGEVARLKTATANAADAGALAGASWVASSENELAEIARGMWMAYMMVLAILFGPFCIEWMWLGILLWTVLFIVNYVILYTQAAQPLVRSAWKTAKATAAFTAIQNMLIDDQDGEVSARLEEISEEYQKNDNLPLPIRLDWRRTGADGVERASWAEVDVQFTNPNHPEMQMGSGISPLIFWLPVCIYACCYSPIGYGNPVSGILDILEGAGLIQSAANLTWLAKTAIFAAWGGALYGLNVLVPFLGLAILFIASLTTCSEQVCFPIIIFLFNDRIVPDGIDDATGDVIVTVRQHREGRGRLRFWDMKYPNVIESEARAHYSGADVGLMPDPDAKANLISVR